MGFQITGDAHVALLLNYPRDSREKTEVGILTLNALLLIFKYQQLLMLYQILGLALAFWKVRTTKLK